jgi:class 3 adenylate cyclase
VVTLVATEVICSTEWSEVLGRLAGRALAEFQRELAGEVLQDFRWAWVIEGQEEGREGPLVVAFMRPSDAVRFALLLQARIRSANAGVSVPLIARVGIHMGEALVRRVTGGRGVARVEGEAIETVARVLATTRGGQILMTGGVFRNALAVLKGSGVPGLRPVAWVNHGVYRIQGTSDEAMELCEAGEHGPAPFVSPPENGTVRRLARAS